MRGWYFDTCNALCPLPSAKDKKKQDQQTVHQIYILNEVSKNQMCKKVSILSEISTMDSKTGQHELETKFNGLLEDQIQDFSPRH